MSTRVTPVRDEVREIARIFDPARIEAYEAKQMIEECAEIERFGALESALAAGQREKGIDETFLLGA